MKQRGNDRKPTGSPTLNQKTGIAVTVMQGKTFSLSEA